MQSLGADLGGALVAGGIGAIGNIAGGVIQGEYNKDINASNIEAQAKANESNEAFAEKWNQKNYDFSKAAQEWQQQFAENQFNWNKYSAENAAQIRVADLKAAGLNPCLPLALALILLLLYPPLKSPPPLIKALTKEVALLSLRI